MEKSGISSLHRTARPIMTISWRTATRPVSSCLAQRSNPSSTGAEPEGLLLRGQGRGDLRIQPAHIALRAGQYLQPRPGSSQASFTAQAGDPEAPRPAKAGRLRPDPAVRLLQELPREGGGGSVQGQKDLRQAGAVAKRDAKREMERAMREKNRG